MTIRNPPFRTLTALTCVATHCLTKTERTTTALRCHNSPRRDKPGHSSTSLDCVALTEPAVTYEDPPRLASPGPTLTAVLNARKLRCRFELVPEPCHAVSESLRGFVSDASSTHFDQAFQAVLQVAQTPCHV